MLCAKGRQAVPMETAQPEVTALEHMSPSNHCSPGLAMIGAAMANGGSLGGVKVLGEKGWKALHADPTPGGLGFAPDNPLDMTYFTQVNIISVV